MSRPFSQACENNKSYIVEVLGKELPAQGMVLEVGSGTGQHAAWFSQSLPGIHWVPSEIPESLPTLLAGLAGIERANLSAPLALEAGQLPWPVGLVDAVYTANTLHIMSLENVGGFFQGVALVLPPGGKLFTYGPFRYDGAFTSPSNARFDEWLKQRDPVSGVRDIEYLQELAAAQGLYLLRDHAMPANNQLLVWERQADESGV